MRVRRRGGSTSSGHRGGGGGGGGGLSTEVLPPPRDLRLEEGVNQHEEEGVVLLENLLLLYVALVKKRLQDLVPKAVMYELTNGTASRLQTEMVTAVYKEEAFPTYFEEDPAVVSNRRRWAARVDVLSAAQQVLTSRLMGSFAR